MDAVFALRNVEKRYSAGGTSFRLSIPHLTVERGAKLALIGESGSGKSTLLELLAMIGRPSEGGAFTFNPDTRLDALDVTAAWQAGATDRLSDWRSRYVGYVLQYGGLLPYLCVRKNIELPRRLLELPPGTVADELAAKLGISQQLDKLPSELSVGQRQRAAIARALAHEPPVVIADEPTAAIDPLNAERIIELLVRLTAELRVTLILASHAQDLMRRAGFMLVAHRIDAADEHTMVVSVSNA